MESDVPQLKDEYSSRALFGFNFNFNFNWFMDLCCIPLGLESRNYQFWKTDGEAKCSLTGRRC